ncbi:DUF4974 domain-containing protein [Algoriphagus sp. H41]|uniref:DUF4974 domain-containing protein n=1 Tax=Algoriphagus oliviformis TaxID=2811231 RepID=A0ABS3C4A1_9BACT|nr:FecR domain-containing protein [Algoriphagus oliviformis]MBN7811818.1 DUF4974 domain-containing protein [Algoriphagus oliviformis]
MRLHPTLAGLVGRILRGKASSAEVKDFNRWYSGDEGEKLEIADHRGRSKAQIEQELLAKIQARTLPKADRRKSNPTGFGIWRVAAAVTLAIGLGWLAQKQLGETLPSEVQETSFVTFQNGTGMIKRIKLPDGSSVKLFHRTSIQVAENFSENRLVKLEGEAFFEVKRDSLHPFRIESAQLLTEVLGTSFLVKSHPDGPELVAVKTGLVKVSDSLSSDFLLKPDFRLDYGNAVGTVREIAPKDPVFAWTEDVLAFQNTPMAEMVQRLEDWYGVQISHNLGETNTCEISGSYQNENLENLLQLVQYSIPFTYQIDGKNVTLHFNPCP